MKTNSILNNAGILILAEAGSWGGRSADFGERAARAQIVLLRLSLGETQGALLRLLVGALGQVPVSLCASVPTSIKCE